MQLDPDELIRREQAFRLEALGPTEAVAYEVYRAWVDCRVKAGRRQKRRTIQQFQRSWELQRLLPVAETLIARGWQDRVGVFVSIQFEAMARLNRPGLVTIQILAQDIAVERMERFLNRYYVRQTGQGGVGWRPTLDEIVRAQVSDFIYLVECVTRGRDIDRWEFTERSLHRLGPVSLAALERIRPGFVPALPTLDAPGVGYRDRVDAAEANAKEDPAVEALIMEVVEKFRGILGG